MVVVFSLDVLVAALVEGHPDHTRCASWVSKAKRGELTMLVAQTTVTELFAALTALPVRPRITPGMASRLVKGNIDPSQVIAVSPAAVWAVVDRAARTGARSREVAELLVIHAAQSANADHVLSLDHRSLDRLGDVPSGFVLAP
ncbi:MAG: hypothetical protein JSS65_01825 [Armatimonadetes bacterium]|nr:hypothetical protein [Armatimonadota bacterium]